MASCLRSILLTITVLHVVTTIPPSSASNNIIGHSSRTSIRVAVHHRDASKGFTKSELLSRAIQRGKLRWQRFASSTTKVPFTAVSPSSGAGGENIFNMSIGTPPQSKVMVYDTGSDLIWTQCKPCSSCFPQVTPLFDQSKSSSYKTLNCGNQLCQALPSYICDTKKHCNYSYGYGDGSITQGSLSKETFTFPTKGQAASLTNMTFGCGTNNGGTFSNTDGLAGLGQGPLSLPSQFSAGNRCFAYCIVDFLSTEDGHIYFGSLPSNKMPKDSQSTPIQKNNNNPTYYYVQLEGISINGKPLKYNQSSFAMNKDGSGGMILDSGTTLTFLPDDVTNVIRDKMMSVVKLDPYPGTSSSGLSCCWYYEEGKTPKVNMTYKFADASMTIPASNMLVDDYSDDGDELTCLVTEASPYSELPAIYGNVHQQNFVFKYDLDKKKISFAPQKCSVW